MLYVTNVPIQAVPTENPILKKNCHEKTTRLGKSCVTMSDLMDIFYEITQLSDVICDECTKSSSTTRKSNFEKTTVLKSPMQLRISLQ